MVTLQFQPIGAPEKCLDRAIQISASSWRKTMNRRHSQSSNATPVKSADDGLEFPPALLATADEVIE